MYKKSLFFLSVIVSISFNTSTGFSAWEAISPFALVFTGQAIDTQINQLIPNSQDEKIITLNDQKIDSPFSVMISGIQAKVNFSFDSPKILVSGRKWQITSKNLAATIHISKIDATQTIDRNVNGVIVHLRLDAICQDLNVALNPQSAFVQAIVGSSIQNNQINIGLEQFQMNWSPGAWQVQNISCTGAEGFGDVVQNEVQRILSNPTAIQASIQSYLQGKISQAVGSAMNSLMQYSEFDTGTKDAKVFLQPEIIGDDPTGGFRLEGHFHIQIPRAYPNETVEETIDALMPSRIDNAVLPVLIVPVQAMTAFLKHIHESNLIHLKFDSNKFKAIKSLINSRIEQFFVWPDLLKFSRRSIFNFETTVNAPFEVNLDNVSELSGTFGGSFATQMFAPKNGQYVAYVNAVTPAQGHFSILVGGGNATVGFNSSQITFDPHWDSSYVQTYHPNQRVSSSLISSLLTGVLDGATFDFAIPPLKVGPSVILKPREIRHLLDSDTLSISLDPG